MPMSDFIVTQEVLDDRGTQGLRDISHEPRACIPSTG